MASVAVAAAVVIVLALLGSLSQMGSGDLSPAAAALAGGSASGTASPAAPATTTGSETTGGATTAPTPAQGGAAPQTTLPGGAGQRGPSKPAEQLRAAIARAMRLAGPDSGALVYDITNGEELYAQRAAVARPPASVEKLWTTTAVILKLGPAARLHTTILGTGHLRRGVWHGNLYLRGGGDPTLGDATFNRDWEQGYGPTAQQLVAQLQARGIHAVSGQVFGDGSLFDRRRGGLLTRYAPDVPDFGGQLGALTYDHGYTPRHYSPATFAAHELVLTMRGARIRARASSHEARTPRGARLLAIVSSPPVNVLTRLMDVPSDDLFAELLTKQLGVLFGAGGTITAGANVIAQAIASGYGLHPGILDGSGLSRSDRSSPLEVVELLRALWHTTVGDQVAASLPTVGVDGTVQTIAVHTAARGRCIAKTGTLDYVTNLAGYCAARGGDELAFALFDDGPGNATALMLEGRIVAAIARY